MPIRILIVDDHSVIRRGLRILFDADPEMEVVGEAGDGREAIRQAELLRPDVVLLDVSMPVMGGLEAARKLKEGGFEGAILFLTMHEDESLLHEALGTGAAGYVIKRAEDAEILAAVHAAHRGDIYVHPAMTRALFQRPRPATPEPSLSDPLTRREIEVLRLLARGNTNRQLAEAIGISIRTAEGHRANILGKLGLTSRVELVAYAEKHGLL